MLSTHPPLTITSVAGIRVGHAQDAEALTGCTVILCEGGASGGIDLRGGAPGTRQTDGLHPMHLVQQVHAVVLAGGSAFGLDCASGVVRYLEERGVGFDVRVARVPIVPTAILFDLGIGCADVRPDAAMGYQACLNASTQPPAEGNAGAGMGATVGKALGLAQAVKSGIGTYAIELSPGLVVGAIAAVNAFGDIIDPSSGRIVAGARRPTLESQAGERPDLADLAGQGQPGSALPDRLPTGRPGQDGSEEIFADAMVVLRQRVEAESLRYGSRDPLSETPPGNTVIGVVATNARLNKEEANKVAQMAHDGLARTVRPAHTMVDGDTIFALSTGERPADVSTIGAFAAEAFAQAVLRAVRTARPAGGLPCANDFVREPR